jgi:tetratricopeptide (TPR) repeat protein
MDQDPTTRPDRVDPRLRTYGEEIKKLQKAYGYKSLQELIRELPDNTTLTEASLNKLLNGRSGSNWFKAIPDIAMAMALRHRKIYPKDKWKDLASIAEEITTTIFGDPAKDAYKETTPAIYSFQNLTAPRVHSQYADDFLNAKSPTLSDIAANFDIIRTQYTETTGLKNRVFEAFNGAPRTYLFTLSGKSGSGKTVISMRLAFDCIEANYKVYHLPLDFASPIALSRQIQEIAHREKTPILFIVDNALRLMKHQINLVDVFKSIVEPSVPIIILGIEVSRITPPIAFTPTPKDGQNTQHWTIGELTDSELNTLVDHIVTLETSRRVAEVRCNLSKELRLKLCGDSRNRAPAVALLVLRYGQSISEILIAEFESIEGSIARDLFTYVITFSGLSLNIPTSCFSRIIKNSRTTEPSIWSNLERIASVKEGRIGLRHDLFFRHIAPHAIPKSLDRTAIITRVISFLSDNNSLEDDFANELFGKVRAIADLLFRDEEAIRQLIQEGMSLAQEEIPEAWKSNWLVCLGRLEKNVIFDHNLAESCFSEAIRFNSFNKFAHRERSWNLLRAGEIDQAEIAARMAADTFPNDVETLIQSANVLQYTTESGFDYAGNLFTQATQIDPNNIEAGKLKDRYEDAAAYRHYITKEWGDLQEDILEKLKAPWFIWRIRKGENSARTNRAIKGKLGSLIRDPVGDQDQAREISRIAIGANDNFIKSLVSANLARIHFIQWYQNGEAIDFIETENLFLAALSNAPLEPFIHTWYGTFVKEVKGDTSMAETIYRKAIALAAKHKQADGSKPFEDHPMLLNNLALLLIQQARMELNRKAALDEAESLLLRAIKKGQTLATKFTWHYDTFEDLRRLRSELM